MPPDIVRDVAYSAMVRRMLISSPGDVPAADLHLIHKAVNRWNGIYGPAFASAVVPISWGAHAAAEFGRSPQDVLNDQIVDGCDMCIAIFANRLGTPTASAESGTAEEIQRLHRQGKYVAVLRSRRPVEPADLDLDQAKALESYLGTLGQRALVLEYRTNSDLENHVDSILAAAVAQDAVRGEAEFGYPSSGADPGLAVVWPRVQSTSQLVSSGRGERVARSWKLVLTNTGHVVANDVQVSFAAAEGSPGEAWELLTEVREGPVAASLAPYGGEAAIPLLIVLGSAPQVECAVSWIDRGGEHRRTTTLRLA